MGERRRVLLVGTNRSWLEALGQLADVDAWVYESQAAWAERAEWTAGARCFRGVLIGDYAHAVEATEDIRRYAEWLGVEAVVPGVEFAVRPASFAAADLGLRGLGTGAAIALTNKAALRRSCEAGGVSQPAWQEIPTLDQLPDAVRPPAVVKPSNLQASEGVTLVCSERDLHEVVTNVEAALSDLPAAWPGTSFLVEELVEGSEFSTEALVIDGEIRWLSVTDKHVAPGSRPVEIGHDVPAVIDKGLRDRMVAATQRLVTAVGAADGILHAEWRVRDDEPYLIECAGRAPGDYILQMAEDAWDFLCYGAVLDVLSGRTPGLPEAPTHGAAIRYLVRPPGRVRRASLNAVDSEPGVRDARLYLTEGDEVRQLRSSWDRCGHVRVCAQNPEEARDLAEACSSRILLDVDTA